MLLTFIVLAFGLTRCGDGSDKKSGGGECSNTAALPDVSSVSSQVVFTITEGINPCTVQGFVVGYQDDLKVSHAGGNSYFINNIPAGSHDIIITSQTDLGLLNIFQNAQNKGLRLGQQDFLSGVRKDKGELELPASGSITGVVKLANQSDHAGIQVYIPGTSYSAITDSNGSYSISSVPVGVNNLNFESAGYHRGQIEALTVDSGAVTTAPNIELILSTGAEGFIIIAGGAEAYDSRTVPITVGATADAVLMKISESDTFNNTPWTPIVSTTSYTFDTEGDKTLYVKFADANGLESSPFDDSINVDLFQRSDIKLLVTEKSFANYEIDINIPKNGSKMILSLYDDFRSTDWEDVRTPITLSLAEDYNLCGNKTLYIKFKDNDGVISESFSSAINVSCWNATSLIGAPSARTDHTAVWTGSKMIVWGGRGPSSILLNDGGIFNPSTNSWSSISTVDAPDARSNHLAVWTGSKMIVWGGNGGLVNGGIYDPIANTWTTISTANGPEGINGGQSAVWTGERMLVFGGSTNVGRSYNPSSDTWSMISSDNAPSAFQMHAAVWTGSKMIIWGGWNAGVRTATGAIYDPDEDSWTSMNTVGAPTAVAQLSATWMGSKMFVFGGHQDNDVYSGDVGLYTLDSDSWQIIDETSQVPGRCCYSAIWTGKKVVVWGGAQGQLESKGGLFNPTDNTWIPIPEYEKTPERRYYHTAVWSGSKIIYWGGQAGSQFEPTNTGGMLSVWP
ncbi:MAG: Kelch repeat-containing protein [Oligoflexus sp.]